MRRWLPRILICLILGAIIAIAGAWGLSWYWFTKDKQGSNLGTPVRIVVDGQEYGIAVSGEGGRFGSWAVMTTWYDTLPDMSIYDESETVISSDRNDLPYWSAARQGLSRGGPEQERAFGFPFLCMSYQLDIVMPDEKQARREEIRTRYREERFRGPQSGENPRELHERLRDGERAEMDALSRNFATYIHGKEYEGTRQVSGTTTRYTYGAWPLRPIWPGLVANAICWGGLLFLLFFGSGLTRQFIRRRRGACLKCGYLLRGEYESGCPECGWNREGTETKKPRDEETETEPSDLRSV